MGQITSLFAHKVVRQVKAPQRKRASLLASLGLDPDAPVDPRIMVADADYYQFFEKAAHADEKGIDLPLRVGASMQCADYGAFGLAWKSALNLRGSCERAERYARILTSVSTYQLRDTEEGVYMSLHRDGERSLGLRLSNEATIASIAAISQEVSKSRFQALAIFFKHDEPGTNRVHEQHFGCPVHFGRAMDALLISQETMLAPNRLGDNSILNFFDQHLDEELAKFDDDVPFERQVQNFISQLLSQGVPALATIADHFAISGRTLQRRLAQRGCSFQTVVDDSRRELAQRLLTETSYPLTEIAFLTGFSEQSAFNRAFKRWAGQTPRSYRINLASSAK